MLLSPYPMSFGILYLYFYCLKIFSNFSRDFFTHWLRACYFLYASLVGETVKRLPAMRETRVQSLGREDPLEKEIGTHSSILAWKIPWTEEPGGLQSMRLQRVRHDWVTSLSIFYIFMTFHFLLMIYCVWNRHYIWFQSFRMC